MVRKFGYFFSIILNTVLSALLENSLRLFMTKGLISLSVDNLTYILHEKSHLNLYDANRDTGRETEGKRDRKSRLLGLLIVM